MHVPVGLPLDRRVEHHLVELVILVAQTVIGLLERESRRGQALLRPVLVEPVIKSPAELFPAGLLAL